MYEEKSDLKMIFYFFKLNEKFAEKQKYKIFAYQQISLSGCIFLIDRVKIGAMMYSSHC